ncbi:hypothetical protein WMY93_023582 [Mugilogobius chulae]|uniref:Uncharacterized protein n=1 Tax=Mugilogobius chulae TaxID=88201 RepID=A0AAW0NBN2_9GOBI
MAEFLLKEGADVNAADDNKRSPLMMAAGNGQFDMLQLLLRYDADITLRDDKGWSADDYATKHGHHACSHSSITMLHRKVMGLGFPLGGPAIDKDDFEDDSLSESVSRVSKSGADDWASDNDNESPIIQKKPKKYNLRQMFASKAGGASVQLDTSQSGVESEPEPEIVPQTSPRLPKALPSTSAQSNPVDPLPKSLPFKPPRMSSTPLSSYSKQEMSTDDDSDHNEELKDEDDEEEEEEEEGEEPEESEHSHDAASTIPETDGSKDKKRDFMSELGLEKEEPIQDSWDSESDLDDGNLLYKKTENTVVNEVQMSTVKEEKEEINSSEVTHDQDTKDDNSSLQKETEKSKWEPLLNKLEGVSDKKTNLMEELGLGDADDLADTSDWDSASTTSKHTLPGGAGCLLQGSKSSQNPLNLRRKMMTQKLHQLHLREPPDPPAPPQHLPHIHSHE